MRKILLAVLVLAWAGLATAYETTRVSSYDWQCLDAAGTKISDHQREGSAITACANLVLKDGKTRYVQGGKYRITATLPADPAPVPTPVPTPTPTPVPAPSGTATYSWIPPTTNTDGTALTNLSGYKIYYGTQATVLDRNVTITGAGTTSYKFEGLPAGTWYAAIVALAGETQSSFSPVVSKTVQ